MHTTAITLASVAATNKPFRVSAEVVVNGSTTANALIDSGSTDRCFIDNNLAKQLRV